MASSHGIGKATAIGAGIGLLWIFRPIRLLFGLLCLYLVFLYLQDSFSETTIDGEDHSVYQLSTTSIHRSKASFDPMFDVEFTIKNKTDMYLQGAEMTAILLECPTPDSDVSQCEPVDKKQFYADIQKPGRFRYYGKQSILFDTKDNHGAYYWVNISVRELSFDKDRTIL